MEGQINFFVGTYTDSIYKIAYNIASQQYFIILEIQGVRNPSFIKFIKEDNILIAISEVQDKPVVTLIDTDKSSCNYGKIIQELPTNGSDPCYICYSKKNNLVIITNYSGSSISTYQYREKQLTLIETIKYDDEPTGEVGVKLRQEVPHPHSVILDSTEKYAFVQDLGCDSIRIYELNSQAQPIQLKNTIYLPAGCGPRHLCYKNNKFYLNGELNNMIYVFEFDKKEITLNQIFSYELFKQGSKEASTSYSSEIRVDEDGKIYNSCRIIDRLFIIPQNGQDVKLPSNEEEYNIRLNQPSISTYGKWPRHFTLHKQMIICANQHSNNIVFFDKKTYAQRGEISIISPAFIELI